MEKRVWELSFKYSFEDPKILNDTEWRDHISFVKLGMVVEILKDHKDHGFICTGTRIINDNEVVNTYEILPIPQDHSWAYMREYARGMIPKEFIHVRIEHLGYNKKSRFEEQHNIQTEPDPLDFLIKRLLMKLKRA